jgi:DNA invertase Pin-like site-specific DNA recombinase
MIEIRDRIAGPSSALSGIPATIADPELGAISVPSVRTVVVLPATALWLYAPGMRILDVARLSNDTDASTSIERQHDANRHYAAAHEYVIVAPVDDVDISGAVSPFDRPELGPWLNGRSGEWDAIVVHKLDRLTRSLAHLVELLEWCQARGKTIISVSESLDFSTPHGRMFAHLLGVFAQFERERIGERVADSRKKTRANGWWAGGQAVPWGYRAVKVADHYELAVDEFARTVINSIANMIIGGSSIRQAARAHGRDDATLVSQLKNQALRGYVMHDGQPVRGEDGMPVTREAVLDDGTWDALQRALERLSRPDSGVRNEAALLLRVLYWGSQPLYVHRRPGRGDRYRTGPKVDKSASFDATACEAMVESALMSTLGHLPMRRLEITPAVTHTAELAKVDASITDIEAVVTSGEMPPKSAARMLAALEARREALSALESRPEVQRYVETGQSFAQYWEALDAAQRHALLLGNGVHAEVRRGVGNTDTLPEHTTETYDDKTRYTMRVTFTGLATLLGR